MFFKSLSHQLMLVATVLLGLQLGGCTVTYTTRPSFESGSSRVVIPVYVWVRLNERDWELRTPAYKMEATILAGSLLFSRQQPCPRGSSESFEVLHFVAGDDSGSVVNCGGKRSTASTHWFRSREFTDTLPHPLQEAFRYTERSREEERRQPNPGRRRHF